MTEIKKQIMKMPTEGDQDHLEQHIQIHSILNTVQDYCISLYKMILDTRKDLNEFSKSFQDLFSKVYKAISSNQQKIIQLNERVDEMKGNPLSMIHYFNYFVEGNNDNEFEEFIIIPKLRDILDDRYEYLMTVDIEQEDNYTMIIPKDKKFLSIKVPGNKPRKINGLILITPVMTI